MKQVKFEWIFATLLLVSLNIALYSFTDGDIRMTIVMAMVSAFSASIGYIFGKSTPDK